MLKVLFLQDFKKGTTAAHGDILSIRSSKLRQKLDNKKHFQAMSGTFSSDSK
jgi:hypothetical protein